MKVLQINSVCGVGSTGRIATDIERVLKKRGHKSYIGFGKNVPLNCESFVKIGSRINVYSHVVVTRILDNHGFGSKKATKKFIDMVIELNPDIIHLHNIHGYYIHIELLFDFLKRLNKPVIWTLHDCWAFTGHCAHFEHIGCDRWRSGCFKCPQKNEYPKSVLFDNSKKNYARKKELFLGVDNLTIVTPSKWLASLVRDSFLSEYSVKVISNGINLDIFKPRESAFKARYGLSKKFVILGVANVWQEKKGFNYFLELAKQIKKDEAIIMVGLTEKQLNQLPKGIIGIAKTNSITELAEIYSAADVLVNPTLEETLGLVNVEALATGTPVVTFNTGGAPETIDDSCGLVVKKDSLNELIKAINVIKENGKHLYSDSCVERAKTYYNKEERYEEYIKLYRMSVENVAL